MGKCGMGISTRWGIGSHVAGTNGAIAPMGSVWNYFTNGRGSNFRDHGVVLFVGRVGVRVRDA